MKLNKTILKAYATKEYKERLDNIVLVTDSKELQESLVSDICILYFQNDVNFINELKELLKATELENMIFCPIMKKDNNEIFVTEFNSSFLRITIDVDAWKTKNNKSDTYYLLNTNELIKNITDFAVKRGYYLTGVKELDESKKDTNLDNTVILVDSIGMQKSLQNIGFNAELLNLQHIKRYKSKNIILVNNNNKETVTKLLSYCFTLKVVNTSVMDKDNIVNLINITEPKRPKWLTINDKGNYKLNQDFLATQYIESTNLIQVLNMDKLDTYIYDKGAYKLITKDRIRKDIGDYVPTGLASNKFISDTVAMVSNRAKLINFEELNADENLINFKNGIYNLETGKLQPHSPSIYSTLQLNANFGTMKKVSKWQAYLETLCTDKLTGIIDYEKMEQLQLWGGLTISNIPMHKVKASLCLFSKHGDTGKSIFLNTLIALLGQEHTATTQIQDLAGQFAMSGLYGKRANIVGDQKATTLQDSSIFKQLTGGDYIRAEFKGKTPFSFKYTGGLLFACNTLPYISDDKGNHIYDRLHIIPFNNVIPIEQRNPNLLNELKEELDHIAMWFMAGLIKFINNDYKIYRCKASVDAVEHFRENNDHLYSFLVNNYEITGDAKDRVVKTQLEDHYIKWCEEEEIPDKAIISKRGFKNIMLDSYNIGCMQANDGKRYYKGLKAKVIASIEQGEEVEKEVKEIFKNVDAKQQRL